VQDDMNGKDPSNPSMQQHVGGVGPVAQPKQDVVSSRKEDDEGQIVERKRTRAPHDIGHAHIVFIASIPCMWQREPIARCSRDDIDDDKGKYVKALARSRCVANFIWKRPYMIRPDG